MKNELALCEIVLAQTAVMDIFIKHKALGELILIDRISNATSACGIIRKVDQPEEQRLEDVTPPAGLPKKGRFPMWS